MLPKVATHILHQTSRAVTAVQNQTGYTIRNVLQLQTQSSTPATTGGGLGSWSGAGSSSWGSSGAGPGGAKYNAGSRFYNGYTGAGRAVTHANSSTANDGTNGQSDDNDEFTLRRVPLHRPHRPRTRSHSLSIGGRQERGEKLGVLKTVQLHARSKHAFATTVEIPQPSTPDVTRPVIVRRNSTSTPLSSQALDSEPPPPPAASPPPPTLPDTDPAAPQSTTEPVIDNKYKASSLFQELIKARKSRDAALVLTLVQRMRSHPEPPHTAEFNMALEALHETRRPGEPLNIILETYNDMIKRSVLPNTRTYLILILALTDRDYEVNKAIMSLKSRIKRRLRYESSNQPLEESRIEQLLSENNFASAMSLFEAASAITWNRQIIPLPIYSNLIRSCAFHSNIDAAIHVFAHLERRSDLLPSATIFAHLMSVYMNVGDLRGVKDVFDEYKSAVKENRISLAKNKTDPRARNHDILVWNKMIEAFFRCGEYVGAMNLLEQMMDSKADEMDVTGVPSPSSSTFTHIIAGFCQAGDTTSALNWFDRLLQQDTTARHPHETSTIPSKPDELAWMVMLEALALEKRVPDLNRLFGILVQNAGKDGLEIRATDRMMLFEANMEYFDEHKDMPKEDAIKTLTFLVQNVLALDESNVSVKLHRWGRRKMIFEVTQKYLQFGDPVSAFDVLEPFVQKRLEYLRQAESSAHMNAADIYNEMLILRDMVKTITSQVVKPEFVQHLTVSFEYALRMLHLSDATGFYPSAPVARYYVDAYALSKSCGEAVELKLRDWELLAYASTALELPNNEEAPQKPQHHKGTVALLEDFKKHDVDLEKFNTGITRRIVKAVFLKHGIEELQALFTRLGPDYERALNNPGRDGVSLLASLHDSPPKISQGIIKVMPHKEPVRIDVYHSRYVEEFFPNHPTVTPLLAYSRFEAGVAQGIYPVPSAIGRLINALGRLKEMDKVRTLYKAAQLVLSTLESSSHWQSNAWFQIEDQMIIACAHAGEMDAAFEHRQRIIEQGGTPSADAYGGLIECVKDTTDDTSNAISLYRESQAVGCLPNVYLFNTIISKLAKARKADFALELFQEMKSIEGIRPSSITYGAVIAACARVGDAMSAEQLFLEMSEQRNFRPRIPPYNTMMQLYVHTKPNRERVLYYYDLLLKTNIRPSEHTYKLLLDAYGTIEPVDIHAMGDVFSELERNRHVAIQGVHWASLINAWGCVHKDLDKAIALFESIFTHPSTARSSGPMPDAVTYEALINVLVTHRRMDLVQSFLDRLRESGIHMTAYIANLLIKGHAAVGDIDQARSVFESLEDPPQGMAATSNHAPHSSSPSSPKTPATGPCHREPSTWEAMFRAELGAGNRGNAIALLEGLQARQYPPAVYNRISGIMLDDAVSPWAAS
ncbi:hypothetical protein PILCRDRAFT_823366 [Piloderma croceum F 1598]|uniref:PROP1-like PPR domain-containing protein n=1 Tax=Piloderma croceum (strain F 1598) TaxID=765440 RepID=A0A0C3FID6_PILCF|nr:hypothetical protein PILCRDRAFT_823366 [Piloderma croceum F 1598]